MKDSSPFWHDGRLPTLEDIVEFFNAVQNVGHFHPQLRRWEHVYHTVRPHQARGYLTPLAFLERWKSQQKKAEYH